MEGRKTMQQTQQGEDILIWYCGVQILPEELLAIKKFMREETEKKEEDDE